MEVLQGTYSNDNTVEFFCGDSLNILTSGTWTGEITVQRREKLTDEFVNYRLYSSTNDFNVNESITETGDGHYYRLKKAVTSGDVKIKLSNYGYTNEAVAYIKTVIDAKTADVSVEKSFANNSKTIGYFRSLFSSVNGYPKCADFFQDRFILANITAKPNGIWFSKTSDYTNFDEVIKDGTLTDDSAINTSVVARNDYNIKNILVAKDLCIFTGDDERIISDGSSVTPTNISIRRQSSWGSTEKHVPFIADNRVLYIHSNNKFLRDFGYDYQSDGYTGNELTLFIHDFIDDEIKDYTYAKYPENLIYFVLKSGKMICLTYLVNEKVFAWSEFVTDGLYEQVETITENGEDVIYVVVNRNGVRRLEKFSFDCQSSRPCDYVMLDSAIEVKNSNGAGIKVPHLANKTVWVLTSGDILNAKSQKLDSEGNVIIMPPVEGTYEKIIIGLPYELIIELPPVHSNTKHGSTIAMKKSVTSVVMDLKDSFYGDIYTREGTRPNPIFSTINSLVNPLDSNLQVNLYSGLIELPLSVDANTSGGIIIKHVEPYPFKMLSIARDIDM